MQDSRSMLSAKDGVRGIALKESSNIGARERKHERMFTKILWPAV